VEYDPKIAAVAQMNGFDCTVADARAVDYATLPRVDWLHASPPCINASRANVDGGQTTLDDELADAVCRAVRALQPEFFSLENVFGYRAFEAFGAILAMLNAQGYMYDYWHLNSADYGVPQTRSRLILLARQGMWQIQRPAPTCQEDGGLFLLPPWVGWHAAICDLVPTLPDSVFAPWQLARLAAAATKGITFDKHVFVGGANKSQSFLDFAIANRPSIPGIREGDDPMTTVPADGATNHAGRAFIMSNAKTVYGDGIRAASEPCHSVTSQSFGRTRAFLMDGVHGGTRLAHEPASTVVADGGSGTVARRAWLDHGRVVAMTPRALARFQSFPDSYVLPENKALAGRVIGNACAPLLFQRIGEALLES